MENKEDQVILWPSKANYPAFRAAVGSSAVDTYAEFIERAEPFEAELAAQGFNVIKVDPDVDAMVAWCRANFGNVESKARAAYAAFVALQDSPEGEGSA